jgi:hypothetical protein
MYFADSQLDSLSFPGLSLVRRYHVSHLCCSLILSVFAYITTIDWIVYKFLFD